MRLLLSICLSFGLLNPLELEATEPPEIKLDGLMIWVDDLQAARDFYVGILDFQPADEGKSEEVLTLSNQGLNLYLRLSKERKETRYDRDARTTLTIEVAELLPAIDQLRKAGIRFEENQLQRNGVGISIPFHDPSGNLLSLMEVQVREAAPFEGFRIYNIGITSSDMAQARSFYIKKLGFEAWSLDYLPAALPLKHADGSFAFMLHEKKGLTNRHSTYGLTNDLQLVFNCNSLKAARAELDAQGIKVTDSAWKNGLVFNDPFGNFLHVKPQ